MVASTPDLKSPLSSTAFKKISQNKARPKWFKLSTGARGSTSTQYRVESTSSISGTGSPLPNGISEFLLFAMHWIAAHLQPSRIKNAHE